MSYFRRYSSHLQTWQGGSVSVLWSRVSTFPHPRQKYVPMPGLSPDLYGMKRERGGSLIKVGCAGAESVCGGLLLLYLSIRCANTSQSCQPPGQLCLCVMVESGADSDTLYQSYYLLNKLPQLVLAKKYCIPQ